MSLLNRRSTRLRHFYFLQSWSTGLFQVRLAGTNASCRRSRVRPGSRSRPILCRPAARQSRRRSAHERTEAFDIAGLAGRQHEAGRTTLGVAAGLKALFHSPYSSGRCRHCDPVRAIPIMSSKKRRLSCPVRHPSPRSVGNSGLIIAQYSSDIPICLPRVPPRSNLESIEPIYVNLGPRSLQPSSPAQSAIRFQANPGEPASRAASVRRTRHRCRHGCLV